MKGLFIPGITAEMFRNGCLESIETLMAEGEIYDIEYSRWIPCSERLPEEDGQYLITVKYKHVNDSYEDVYAEHGEWHDGRWDMFCFGHCGDVEDIIAWMPLPEPYQSEIPTGAEGSEE